MAQCTQVHQISLLTSSILLVHRNCATSLPIPVPLGQLADTHVSTASTCTKLGDHSCVLWLLDWIFVGPYRPGDAQYTVLELPFRPVNIHCHWTRGKHHAVIVNTYICDRLHRRHHSGVPVMYISPTVQITLQMHTLALVALVSSQVQAAR